MSDPATTGERSENPTKKQRVMMAGVCLVAFLIVYVLSSGPMVWLHDVFKFEQFQRALEIVYAPIVFLVNNEIEPFATAIRWYVGLFR